jgi:[ribosomal protein S18]-alanine N-acetyltransferase
MAEMPPITIRPPRGPEELRAAAQMMADSEPWVTLRRDAAAVHASLAHPDKEIHVADHAGQMIGAVALTMRGILSGYIQSICVAPAWRGRGVGSALLAHAERRIFQESPNVFLLVSSFNAGARRLYERAGYRQVGELEDFVVRGQSELLLRKTLGPRG